MVALVAIVGVLSQAALAGSSAPFADAANAIWGGTFLGLSWGKWIALVAMAATLGALNGWIMLTARVSLAAADDGLFPKPFARVHGERRTPVFGLLVSSVLVSGLVLYNWNASFADRFTDVVLLATWMTLIAYAYAAAAELVLFFRERELFTWAKLARDSVIAGLAFAYSVWAIWGSGEEWLAKGFMLLLFGIPVYVWMKWRQKQAAGRRRSSDFDRALFAARVRAARCETRRRAARPGRRRVNHEPGAPARRGPTRKENDDAQGHHHGSRRARLPQLQRRLPRRPGHRGRRLHGDADPRHRRPRLPAVARRAALPATGSRSGPRRSSRELIREHDVDEVVLAYSDLKHETVMHKASIVLAAGADFRLMGPDATMLALVEAGRRRLRDAHRLRQEPDEPQGRPGAARRRA